MANLPGSANEVTSQRLQVQIGGRTDVGCVRSSNEDCFIIQALNGERSELNTGSFLHDAEEGDLMLAVSDGMGGAAAGEVASSTALTCLRDHMLAHVERMGSASIEELVELVEQGVQQANQQIFEAAQANKSQKGMGATITALFLRKDTAYLFQIGDSRAYLLRTGNLVRITRDQSFVGHLVEMGTITEEQAARHPQRNVILQALGSNEKLKVDISFIPLCAGDFLLLCTDGLYSEIPARELEKSVTTSVGKEGQEALLLGLVEQAKAAGGHDNITVIGLQCNEAFPKAEAGERPRFMAFPFLKEDNPYARMFQIQG